ncbi:MAG: hypothetical protein IJ294_03610 [Clostridia bacterium]|nr:hypothetical protein [Clostridia bacterium]
MKKVIALVLGLAVALCLSACGDDYSLVSKESKGNSPEEVAAICVESWFEHDFESMLETYPKFRLRYRAVSFGESTDADVKTVAIAMSEYFESPGREVKILSTNLIDQYEVKDYSMFDEIKQNNEYITTEDFAEITQCATIRVDYEIIEQTGNNSVLNSEIKCIKMNEKWYVLSDGAFTN